MSWTIEPTTIDLGLEKSQLEVAVKAMPIHPQEGYAEDESRKAITTAVLCIYGAICEGAFGTSGKVEVYAGGHSNPGNVPEPGWSPDSMNISFRKLWEAEA